MALAPKFAGQKFTAAANPQTLHTLELYLDYVCPFSAKLFNTVYHSVFPLLSSPQYKDKVQFIFRQQIQPWHPSSTLVHEAGVAVLKLDPAKFWPFSDALFKEAKSFYDANIVNETRNQSYTRLSKIAASVGLPEQSFYDLLKISDKPAADGSLNTGNGVTNDLKVLVKFNRSQSIHVTPTVVFDGVVENSISSGWSAEQWKEWLEKNIV